MEYVKETFIVEVDEWNTSDLYGMSNYCDRDLNIQPFQAVLVPLIYGVVLLVGLIGNGLLLAILMRRWGSLRITEIYLLHLALADLILLLTLPFALTAVSAGWVFGDFLCKAINLLNFVSFLCGSLLLACISFDRYLAIVHAVQSLQHRRPWSVHLTCAVVWFLCLGLSAPNAVFVSMQADSENSTRYSCNFFGSGNHTSNWIVAKRFVTHMCFFLPLAIMSYCYSAVIGTLCHSHRTLDKQGAIRLAMTVTLVFFLLWLPYNLSLMVDTLVIRDTISLNCDVLKRLDKVLVVTESIGYMHCSLNPFLYAFLGVRFRQDLRRLLDHYGCLGRRCLHCLRGETPSTVSISGGAATTTNSLIPYKGQSTMWPEASVGPEAGKINEMQSFQR